MPNSSYRQQNVDIRGGYTPYILRPFDMAKGLRETVLARNEQYEKTAEQRRLMENGLSNLPLAAEESEYKANLLKQAQDEINKNPRDVSRAMEIGSNLLNNPVLKGKSTYYQQRENVRTQLNNRHDLTNDERDWYWANHKYDPKIIKDDNGNEVGVEDFSQDNQPLAHIDWTNATSDIAKLANPSSTSKSWSKSSHTNGTGSSSGGHKNYMTLSPEDVANGINRWIQDNYAQVAQQWEVDRFVYNRDVERLQKMSKDDPQYEALKQKVEVGNELFNLDENNMTTLKAYVKNKISKEDAYVKLVSFSRTDTGSEASYNKNIEKGDSFANGYTETVEGPDGQMTKRTVTPVKGNPTGRKQEENN